MKPDLNLILSALLICCLGGCSSQVEDKTITEESQNGQTWIDPVLTRRIVEWVFDRQQEAIDENNSVSADEAIEVVSWIEVIRQIKKDSQLRAQAMQLLSPSEAREEPSKMAEFAMVLALTEASDSEVPSYDVAAALKDGRLTYPEVYNYLEIAGKPDWYVAALPTLREVWQATLVTRSDQISRFVRETSEEVSLVELSALVDELLALAGLLELSVEDPAFRTGIDGALYCLNQMGRFGEMDEGLVNAQHTLKSLVSAAHIAFEIGDESVIRHEIWPSLSVALTQHLMPGRNAVNHSQAYGISRQPEDSGSLIEPLCYLAFLRNDRIALAALVKLFDGYDPSIYGVAAMVLSKAKRVEETQLPRQGYYAQSAVAMWRSSWEEAADGLWVKGGTHSSLMTHHDRGHLSLYFGGKPVLIEGGTFSNEIDPRATWKGAASLHHNVLRIDDEEPEAGSAPLIVRTFDDNRVNVRVDGSKCYPSLGYWHRDIFTKTGEEVRVVDNLSFRLGKRGRSSFSWHVAVDKELEARKDRDRFIFECPDFAIVIQGSETIEVTQSMTGVNRTLNPFEDRPHLVIQVRTIGRPTQLRTMTRFIPRENMKEELAQK